jgi:hypothetical protein
VAHPLDDFEAVALTAIGRGEDMFGGESTPGLPRVLGALRSTGHCVKCHGGERGDLLGAFSYTLRR